MDKKLGVVFISRRYVYSAFLLVILWAMCNLRWAGMFEEDAVVAALAPITKGAGDQPFAALMFNVDWGTDHLMGILDILKEKRAPATFFLTGAWAQDNAELAKRILEEDHEVGNHGGTHLHPNLMSREAFRDLVYKGETSIEQATGSKPSRIFAPPYGEWSDATVTWALEAGYQTILWTVDTVDWREPPWEVIWKRAAAGARPGSLVLLHPTAPTVQALAPIVDSFREKGLQLTKVSEVISFDPRVIR